MMLCMDSGNFRVYSGTGSYGNWSIKYLAENANQRILKYSKVFFFFEFFLCSSISIISSNIIIHPNLLLICLYFLGALQSPDHIPVGDQRSLEPSCRTSKEFRPRHLQHEKKHKNISTQKGSQLHRETPTCDWHTLLSPHLKFWSPRQQQPLQATSQAHSDLVKHFLRRLESVTSSSAW